MKYQILYASGQRFGLSGKLVIVHEKPENGGIIPSILKGEKRADIVDPRAIIWSKGKIVYHPRQKGFKHQKDIQAWLDDHPEWPSTHLGLN